MSTKKNTINLYDNGITPCYKILHSWYPHTTRHSSCLLKQRPAKVDDLQKHRSDFHIYIYIYIYIRTRPDHDQQHCYHHAPTVKPETATAVVELLMMGVEAPETC